MAVLLLLMLNDVKGNMKTREPIVVVIKIYWLVAEIMYVLSIVALLGVFAYFCAMKVRHYATFQEGLALAPQLPTVAAPYLAWIIPLVCFAVCAMIIYGFMQPRLLKLGLWIYLVLMVLFTAFIGYILRHPVDAPCECLGLDENWRWKKHFWVNTGILTITGLAIWLHYKRIVATIGNEHSENPGKK
ncbi:hypothetical protein SAMN05216436_10182 [bacterium A37T11]|nr:hypothetical protein SAMN05216436_10182 [bacterium A37T11]